MNEFKENSSRVIKVLLFLKEIVFLNSTDSISLLIKSLLSVMSNEEKEEKKKQSTFSSHLS